MHEETLARRESTLGPDHPSTLTSRLNLAEVYGSVGRTAETIRMYEETIRLCAAKLGPADPLTIASRNNLAA